MMTNSNRETCKNSVILVSQLLETLQVLLIYKFRDEHACRHHSANFRKILFQLHIIKEFEQLLQIQYQEVPLVKWILERNASMSLDTSKSWEERWFVWKPFISQNSYIYNFFTVNTCILLLLFSSDSIQDACNNIFVHGCFLWNTTIWSKPTLCWSCKLNMGMACSLIFHLVCWISLGWDMLLLPSTYLLCYFLYCLVPQEIKTNKLWGQLCLVPCIVSLIIHASCLIFFVIFSKM